MEDWRQVFETNLFGLIEVTRRAVPLMRAAGGGVICNITSASLAMSVPFYGVYRASKAAVQTMGETLRAEVGQFGIRVVEILPGPVDTDMLANSARRPEAADHPGYEAMAESIARGPHGRWTNSPRHRPPRRRPFSRPSWPTTDRCAGPATGSAGSCSSGGRPIPTPPSTPGEGCGGLTRCCAPWTPPSTPSPPGPKVAGL